MIRVFVAASVLAIAACAPTKVMIVTSQPPGALVQVNGVTIGKTPTAVNSDTLFPNQYADFQLGVQTALTISKDGCENQVVRVGELSIPDNVNVELVCSDNLPK